MLFIRKTIQIFTEEIEILLYYDNFLGLRHTIVVAENVD